MVPVPERDRSSGAAVPPAVERELAARVEDILVAETGQHTVGELAERLDVEEKINAESVGDVHEALHRQVLGDLERVGKLVFDANRGIARLDRTGSGLPEPPSIGGVTAASPTRRSD